MNTNITYTQLFFEIVRLIASIYVSYLAASAVLAVIGGIVGYLIAYCAALGAGIVFNIALEASNKGLDLLAHKLERINARRRNDAMFFVVDC